MVAIGKACPTGYPWKDQPDREDMKQLGAFLRFVVMEFGALIVFWALLWSHGVKPAIAGAVCFAILDGLYRAWRRIPVTRVYVMSCCLVIVLGIVDLFAATPFMIKYEAVATNIAVGLFFVAGSRGDKPLMQEVAEKRGRDIPDRDDVRYFFRLFTLFWALYFLVKAAVYLWLGAIFPLEQALALRTIIGGVSLAAMFAISFQGRQLFFLCRWLGVLPAPPPEPEQQA
jgi:intracellular septation protein A